MKQGELLELYHSASQYGKLVMEKFGDTHIILYKDV